MPMVPESAKELKSFLRLMELGGVAHAMVMRLVLTFMLHHGRMSCSQAGGAILSEPVHRSQITRFLARPRWQKDDINAPLREALLQLETCKGEYICIVDATLSGQAGRKTENTYSTGNRQRRPKKGRRFGKYKHAPKSCHSFTCGLLITPSGYRIPFQRPYYTKEYCRQKNIPHRTSAESAAELVRSLPLPEEAKVIVLGDAAYESQVMRDACEDRHYDWIFPANCERVYAGSRGNRPKLRSRLEDWKRLPLKTIRFRPSTGKYAKYRRLSRWRGGPKTKTRVFYAYQEKREVHSMGRVQIIFSTTKQNLKTPTADDVKILLTNATNRSVSEIIELYTLRWQIELFFKELKSTLGFAQYRFQRFEAVNGWANIAITTALFLEYQRAKRLRRKTLPPERKRWWESQRLHGLREAFRQQIEAAELNYLAERLKTPGGIAKLKRLLKNATPSEYRVSS